MEANGTEVWTVYFGESLVEENTQKTVAAVYI